MSFCSLSTIVCVLHVANIHNTNSARVAPSLPTSRGKTEYQISGCSLDDVNGFYEGNSLDKAFYSYRAGEVYYCLWWDEDHGRWSVDSRGKALAHTETDSTENSRTPVEHEWWVNDVKQQSMKIEDVTGQKRESNYQSSYDIFGTNDPKIDGTYTGATYDMFFVKMPATFDFQSNVEAMQTTRPWIAPARQPKDKKRVNKGRLQDMANLYKPKAKAKGKPRPKAKGGGKGKANVAQHRAVDVERRAPEAQPQAPQTPSFLYYNEENSDWIVVAENIMLAHSEPVDSMQCLRDLPELQWNIVENNGTEELKVEKTKRPIDMWNVVAVDKYCGNPQKKRLTDGTAEVSTEQCKQYAIDDEGCGYLVYSDDKKVCACVLVNELCGALRPFKGVVIYESPSKKAVMIRYQRERAREAKAHKPGWSDRW